MWLSPGRLDRIYNDLRGRDFVRAIGDSWSDSDSRTCIYCTVPPVPVPVPSWLRFPGPLLAWPAVGEYTLA